MMTDKSMKRKMNSIIISNGALIASTSTSIIRQRAISDREPNGPTKQQSTISLASERFAGVQSLGIISTYLGASRRISVHLGASRRVETYWDILGARYIATDGDMLRPILG